MARKTDGGSEQSYWSRVSASKKVIAAALALVAVWFARDLIASGQVNLWGLLLFAIPAFAAGAVLDMPWATKLAKLVTDALPWTSKPDGGG